MRNEAEVRRHRDNLRACKAIPCDCEAGGVHQDECKRGGLMMEAVVMTLGWVLGDAGLQEHVDRIDEEVKRFRAGLN